MRNHKIRFLKVKLKSLAEESRIIRNEEKRCGKRLSQIRAKVVAAAGQEREFLAPTENLREELYLHRIHDVRDEARATHIAYGYLRGRHLEQMEKVPESIPNAIWQRAHKMVDKYGIGENKLSEWHKPKVPEANGNSEVPTNAVSGSKRPPGAWVRLKSAVGAMVK
jgi:hypothetical protein